MPLLSIAEKLEKIRKLMQSYQIDYYYIPATDPHQNEYVPDCWARRSWVTNFTGSAGEALIAKKHAYLWTDARYFLQADDEIDQNHFQLMKQIQGRKSSIHQWISEQKGGKVVGVDPSVVTIREATNLSNTLSQREGKLVAIEENFVDLLWKKQPKIPENPFFIYDKKYAGRSFSEKLNPIRDLMQKNRVDALVVSKLDEIAWLFVT